MTDPVDSLYEAVQTRPRPEDTAQLIQDIINELVASGSDRDLLKLKTALEPAARNSLKRGAYSYSSMARDFALVVGADKMVAKAANLFNIPDPPTAVECLFVEKVEKFMEAVALTIGANTGHVDFLKDRLNREQRRATGLEIKKRPYNHRFRALRRLRSKILKMIQNDKKFQATRVAKSAGATKITKEELGKDLPTAFFVAYMSARMNLRSAFTNTSQIRAFDTIADLLYQNAKKSPTVNWWAIALVHPEKDVLKNLTDEEKGRLLGMWTETLHMLSDLLRDTYQANNFDLQNMIVRRGNDSSTWNSAAGAWNKAREHWLKLLHDLKMEALIEYYLPGKVLRLMASDVVRWHSYSKGSLDDALHPATKVWRDLPRPWEVFSGDEPCPRELVESVCERHNVAKEGWSVPALDKTATQYTPTPELVHGVAVTSPFLAKLLNDSGAFSGHGVKFAVNATVVRDEAGGVIRVEPAASATAETIDASEPVMNFSIVAIGTTSNST